MSNLEIKSLNAVSGKGEDSLAQFIEDFGCELPEKFTYLSNSGAPIGEYYNRTIDYSDAKAEVLGSGIKVYTVNGNGGHLYTLCDGHNIYLVHGSQKLCSFLKEEGYIRRDSFKFPVDWTIRNGYIKKDFAFINDDLNKDFDIKGMALMSGNKSMESKSEYSTVEEYTTEMF